MVNKFDPDDNRRAVNQMKLPNGQTMRQFSDSVGASQQNVFRRGGVKGGKGATAEQLFNEDLLRQVRDSGILGQFSGNNQTINPLGHLQGTRGEIFEMVGLMESGRDTQYYNVDEYGNPIGDRYQNYADVAVDPSLGQYRQYETTMAPLTDVPTTTSDPSRPRTVAAGYSIEPGSLTGKLTVIFRDGTVYNYYDVPPTQWGQFKSWQSKGAYIKAVLDSKPRGVADHSDYSPKVRAEIYRINAMTQVMAKGEQTTRSKGSKGSTIGGRNYSSKTRGENPKVRTQSPRRKRA